MHSLLHKTILSGALAAVCAAPLMVNASPERGLEIAEEADRRDLGWADAETELTMTLRNRNGDESIREMRSRALEVEDDGDKSMIIFDQPRDVRGTALLTFSHTSGDDDQWLYLPALRRVKRIASRNKSGPFMGSEFAFEDLSSQEVEKYTYNYLRDDTLEHDGESHAVFVLERDPVDENSGYTKQIVWMDQAEYRPLQIEFYDRKNSHLKTLTMHDYKQYQEQFWRPLRMEMVNHQTGKSTTLAFSDYTFGVGLEDRDFDQSSLQRAR